MFNPNEHLVKDHRDQLLRQAEHERLVRQVVESRRDERKQRNSRREAQAPQPKLNPRYAE
jgi:hypothetical protein